VALYPTLGPGTPELSRRDEWYQQFDRKPRFEIAERDQSVTASRNQAIRFAARDLEDAQTAGILSTESVRYVLVDDNVYRLGNGSPKLDPRYYTLLKSFPGVRIFSVHAPHVDLERVLHQDRFVIAVLEGLGLPPPQFESGFNDPEPYQSTTGRWLAGEGRLGVSNQTGSPLRVVLSGLAFSNGQPRLLEVEDGAGNVVARQKIPAFAVPLALGPFSIPMGSSTLTLITVPGADPLGGSDPRTGSVFLSGLQLKPLPAYAGT
jgi:hypothetical protein